MPLPAQVLIAVFFFAAFGQTISGFGFALIGMPLATMLVGTPTAAPLVAMVGLTLYAINLLRYRASINLQEVWRLGVAATLGVPIGIWGLGNLDESLFRLVLGLVLIGYAIYSLARPKTTFLLLQRWGYLAGFMTGCLGGAYNLPGPPLIVYGTLRQWQRDEFRAVLQALFFLTGVLTVSSHVIAQHVTADILRLYFLSVPALVLGIVIGSLLDRRINHTIFRWIVLGLILILGASLILGEL